MARGTAPKAAPVAGDATVVGATTRVRGHVRGAGNLSVLGEVHGDVAIDGALAIEDSGGVTGDVSAAAVTIRGALTGDVAATGAVAVLAGAKVVGNLGGAEVSLEEGASFTGRIEAEFELPPELQTRESRSR